MFGQVGDQVGQVKDHVGLGQGQELDNTDDKMVNCITSNNQYQYSHIQVYLVTGGWDNSGLSSTETLAEEGGAWTTAGELPVAMDGLKGVSLNNNIFMTGNIIFTNYHLLLYGYNRRKR